MEQRCAVLLRGINVGKGNRLAMADLRAVLEGLGCEDVSTYLNSGNAVVTADPDGLAERVEAALRLPVRVVVFTADELAEAVAGCPWPDRAKASPKLVHVGYLDRQPSPAELDRLGTRHGDDEVAVGPRVLYLSYATSSVRSPLERALAAARLDVVMTTRNWTTATKLVELTAGP
jgi:uncharacterized protein (DUF1697 family)